MKKNKIRNLLLIQLFLLVACKILSLIAALILIPYSMTSQDGGALGLLLAEIIVFIFKADPFLFIVNVLLLIEIIRTLYIDNKKSKKLKTKNIAILSSSMVLIHPMSVLQYQLYLRLDYTIVEIFWLLYLLFIIVMIYKIFKTKYYVNSLSNNSDKSENEKVNIDAISNNIVESNPIENENLVDLIVEEVCSGETEIYLNNDYEENIEGDFNDTCENENIETDYCDLNQDMDFDDDSDYD